MGLAMDISLCCLGVLITNCFLGAKALSCHPGWLQNEGDCYGYFDEKLSWDDAEAECQSIDSQCHLTSLLSHQESILVAEYIKDEQDSLSSVWVGLHDISGKRQWRWADQSPFNYKAWKENEPNNVDENEHCVVLTSNTSFEQWNDLPCNRLNAYICKCIWL